MSRPTRVLFVCRHNAGRSQLAAALLRARARERLSVSSAGIEPAATINPVAATALLERGINIDDQVPRRLTPHDVEQADVVVSLVPGLALEVPGSADLEEWDLPDPAAWNLKHIRDLIEVIDARVEALTLRLTQAQ